MDIEGANLGWARSRSLCSGRISRTGFAFLIFGGGFFLTAQAQEFTLHKNEGQNPGPTLLIVGGIQGDEPGGFNAASLLATHYRMTRGKLWVVPNLNFKSIVRRSRGVHGDMNRKFPAVPKNDPDYSSVERIKGIMTDERVDYVFNLHDGSGFYRKRYLDAWRNPNRWGQSIIIDQERIESDRYSEIGALARRVSADVNQQLMKPLHVYNVRNTRTREGDKEMAKTLTFFAINNGKPAVGIETSKSLSTEMRVYYQLRVVESYMRELGVEFERQFEMNPAAIKQTIDNNLQVAFYDKRLFFDMAKARKTLRYVPLKKNTDMNYTASSPLVAITNTGNGYRVSYGNRRVTSLRPEYLDYDSSLERLDLRIDGLPASIRPGSMIDVQNYFSVEAPDDYRVNVIGWVERGRKNENRVRINRSALMKRFSIDTQGRIFRVEVYRGKKFTGMVLVRFVDPESTDGTEPVS